MLLMRFALPPFLLISLLAGSALAARAQPAAAAAAAATSAPPKRPAPPDDPVVVHEYGGSAHVMRRDNTDIYIMSKPDRPYVVTGRLVNDLTPATTDEITGTVVLTNVTIPEMIDALLAQARHHQIYYSFPYDAMLTFDGQVGTFVRWKNKAAAPAKTSPPPPADTSSVQQP